MNQLRTGVSDWLSLAAAPTFALMALLTALGGSSHMQPSLLHSMVPMYLLMSAFHLPAWLKLISSRRGASHPAE